MITGNNIEITKFHTSLGLKIRNGYVEITNLTNHVGNLVEQVMWRGVLARCLVH
jgi:hypothetical protein